MTSLGSAALALLGCQAGTANPADSAGNREYALEAQKLKAGPEAALEAGFAALDSRFGYPAAPTGKTGPADGAAPLGKTAAQVYNATGSCARLSKFIFRMSPGDRVVFDAQSRTDGSGTSDPVAALIQFNSESFIQNGTVPSGTGQVGFRILAWNDDVAGGNLSSRIDYTFKTGESGYFMVMPYPYLSASSTRSVSLGLELSQANCPGCDYVIANPVRQLGGLCYRSQGANDFRANRAADAGDPVLYVIKNSIKSGMYNNDTKVVTFLTKNAKVYPYSVTVAEGSMIGNHVLIDNDAEGTASITHLQYAP